MVALDTNILIYALEGNPDFGRKARSLLHANQDAMMLSELVYAEILAAPKLQQKDNKKIALGFLDDLRATFVPLSKEVLILAAELRAIHTPQLGLGDALHVACAVTGGADAFITNDRQLASLPIKDLKISIL